MVDVEPVIDTIGPKVRIVIAILLAVVLGVAGVWDAITLILRRGDLTVSVVIQAFVYEFPWLGVIGGFIAGHLFWQNSPPPK